MKVLYMLVLLLLRAGIRIASLFDSKAKLFVTGRKNLIARIGQSIQSKPGPIVWFHCASLGEFEQARPVIELVRKDFPSYRILLTFFSPSGYEVQKNYELADHVFYLPWDTAANARKFITTVKPALAIFVKYEFWHFFAQEMRRQQVPLVSISAIFRKDQVYFKSYGTFYRNILKNFTYFFVQNDESVRLLKSIGITGCTRAGDTRFDRVVEITRQGGKVDIAKRFKGDNQCWVVGSSWPEDIDVLLPLINESQYKLKFIIAPHEVGESAVVSLEKSLSVPSVRFSKMQSTVHSPQSTANAAQSTALDVELEEATVLIVDTIGHLAKLYQYGEFAYVGGAFGRGLHNILEAACYGIPIFFGNEDNDKYQEAMDLIMRGGAFEISDYADFRKKYELLISRPENYLLACEVTSQYVQENLGATQVIMGHFHKLLRS
jgi:3-deoxy-D-manno-octulosonic-acid transferase